MASYLYIVSRDKPLIFGYLQLVLESRRNRWDSAEVIFDRRHTRADTPPAGEPGAPATERRRHGVEGALLLAGYAAVRHRGAPRSALFDQTREILAPVGVAAGPPAARPGPPRWGRSPLRRGVRVGFGAALVAGSVLIVAGSAMQASPPHPVARAVARHPGTSPEAPGEAGRRAESVPPAESARPALAIAPRPATPSQGLAAAAGALPGGEGKFALAAPERPSQLSPARPAPPRDPPAPAADPGPETAPAIARQAERPERAGPPRETPRPRSRVEPKPAPADVVPTDPVSEPPRVDVLDGGSSNGHRRTYAVRLSDAGGAPVADAEVWLVGRGPDGLEHQARLRAASGLGLYRGSLPDTADTSAGLSLRVMVRAQQFDVAVNR